jgi:hypothetical protein
MVVLDVRDYPYIARVFPQRMARILSLTGSLCMSLARVLLGHADSIKVKEVFVPFGEPQDSFMPA